MKINEMQDAAIQAAGGLDDFGDDEYVAGLEVLLQSLADDAELTENGTGEIYGMVTGSLIGRLLSEAGWKADPSHADIAIKQPIFVTGLARSGTTAMHRLLGADPGHQELQMWLGASPQPRPPRAEWEQNPAFVALDTLLRNGLQGTPEGRGLHYLSAELSDECHLLTAQSMMGNGFYSIAHVPGYTEWLATQDWSGAMTRHRRNLQLIGSTSPEQRWVLKNPGHLAALDGIFAAYPDAIVVQMHRDPRQTIPSVASVIQYFMGHTSPRQNGEVLARFQMEQFAADTVKFLDARKRYDPKRVLDIYYPDFLADPVGTVEGIYLNAGLPYDEGVRQAVEAEYQLSISGERAPKHSYTLEDFGLNGQEVDEQFSAYLDAHPAVVQAR